MAAFACNSLLRNRHNLQPTLENESPRCVK
jgi:hypothetical protein